MDFLLSMSVFRRVAEAGSFSVVTRETGMSQPTVSKHVAALEKRLGTKLINRSTRQLNLTEAGKQYYERCTQILDELAEAEASLRQQQSQPTGTLRVNTPVTFGRLQIVPRLWDFLARYPDLKIELIMDDHSIDLVKEGVDMAIRVGVLADLNLIANKIGTSPRVTVASPNYLATKGEPQTLMDLKRHDCIVYTLLTTQNGWHFTGPRGKEKIRVRGRFSTNNPDAIREAALAGMGIAVTPIWLINNYVEQGQLKVILKDYTPTPFEIHTLYPERRFVPAKVRCFINYLREALKL